MSDAANRDHPVIESRYKRLVAYLRHNWFRMVIDTTIIVVWLFLTTAVFQWLALPQWLLYVVVFIGIVMYSRLSPPWQRPYRSPDP